SAADRAAIPIKHVVVLMKENRSFDHLLGKLHDQGQPEAEALPADFTNPGPQYQTIKFAHGTTTCVPHDLPHQWTAMHLQVDNGKMDGFASLAGAQTNSDGQASLSYYDNTDLPFYYWIANTYALNDRHFPSVRSGTFPDRNFLLLGTADGVFSTGD